MLLGRDAERTCIDDLLKRARDGSAGVLVLAGEAGVGKSALIRYAAEQAAGMRVLLARGAASEAELAFAGLADLLRPVLADLSSIPAPQVAALSGALRLGEPTGGDRFASCAATLSLLAVAAERDPLLVLVDDVQWLDAASVEALVFACRRLCAERIGVVLAVRQAEGEPPSGPLGELPARTVAGLDDVAAEALLDRLNGAALAPDVRHGLALATGGNPLALLEIPQLLSAPVRLGREPLPDPLPVGVSVQRAFERRLDPLPPDTRTALLVAAISDSGGVDEVHPALAAVDIAPQSFEPAEAAGLVTIDSSRVEFRHPLLRSTVYAGATARELRRAHGLLAAGVGALDADRRAWHAASATIGPDEAVAESLEQTASTARLRGGPAGAARAYERSAWLSPQPPARLRRLREAAGDWMMAGEPGRAATLLAEAMALGPDPAERARIVALQAQLACFGGDPGRALRLLTDESDRVAATDPGGAAMLLGQAVLPLCMEGNVRLAAATARRAEALAELAPGPSVLAQVQGLVVLTSVLVGEGRAVRQRLDDIEALLPGPGGMVDARLLACGLGSGLIWIGRLDRAVSLLQRVVRAVRDAGAPAMLAYPLALSCAAHQRSGGWSTAAAAGHEAVTLARQVGQPGDLAIALVCLAELEAAQGREHECRDHAAGGLAIAASLGFRSTETVARRALGLLALGLGDPDEAIGELEGAAEVARDGGLEEPNVVEWAPDLAEAYVRSGQPVQARRVLSTLRTRVARSPQPATCATLARCEGMLCDGDYQRWFTDALGWHDSSGTPFERARTALCFGERLRRDGRRVEARVRLHEAARVFESLGARSWAERAGAELRATGERLPVQRSSAEDRLTPQELQVSLAVGQGATSREAAAALFLSPRTVEYHLGHVYRKLGLRSRSELARLVATGAGPFPMQALATP